MGIERDPNPQLHQYAHPEKLVTSSWLGAKLGGPGLKVVESDSDPILYNIGHLPTAIRIDLHEDLGDPVTRDFLDGEAFAALMDSKGITRDDTVVVYGNDSNLWATYTLWVFELFGHPDVRLLDGGRDAWMQDERETSYDAPPSPTTGYPVVERDDTNHRIFVDEIRANLSDRLQLVDMRDTEDFIGVAPAEATSRTGHIPGAVNFPPRAGAAAQPPVPVPAPTGGDLLLPGSGGHHGALLPFGCPGVPPVVRSAPPSGVGECARLRRFLAGVGKHGPYADRHRCLTPRNTCVGTVAVE